MTKWRRALQVVHHLFPGICHTHYPAIAPIVLATCQEYKIPYKVYPTVRSLQGMRFEVYSMLFFGRRTSLCSVFG